MPAVAVVSVNVVPATRVVPETRSSAVVTGPLPTFRYTSYPARLGEETASQERATGRAVPDVTARLSGVGGGVMSVQVTLATAAPPFS